MGLWLAGGIARSFGNLRRMNRELKEAREEDDGRK